MMKKAIRIRAVTVAVLLLAMLGCSDKDSEKSVDQPPGYNAGSVSKAHSKLINAQQESSVQIEQLQLEIDNISAETTRIQNKIASQNAGASNQAIFASGLSDSFGELPYLGKLFRFGAVWSSIGYGFIIVNGLIWISIKRKRFFKKWKTPLLTSALLLLLMNFSPIVAAQDDANMQQGSKQAVGGMDEMKALNQKLAETIAILESNELQRSILLLEGKAKRRYRGTVKLPKYNTSNPLLQPLQSVTGLGIEYHYTLASLYEEDKQRGHAIENLEKLVSVETKGYSSEDADLVLKGIAFLIDINQATLVKDKIGLVIRRINDPGVLASLADKLLETKFSADAQRAFARAIKKTRDAAGLIALSRALFDKGRAEEGAYALESALRYDCDITQITSIIELSTANQLVTVTTQAVEKAIKINSPNSDEFKENFDNIYGLLLQKFEVGAAVKFFQGTIARVVRNQNTRGLRLLEMAAVAVSHGSTESARLAVQKLDELHGQNALQYTSPLLGVVEKEQHLPNPKDEVSLRTLSATLSEADQRNDEADNAYIEAGTARMQNIIDSFGRQSGQWLNDLLLAREALERNGDEETRLHLEKLYTLLMGEKAQSLGSQHQEMLAELQDIKEKKLAEQEGALSELAAIDKSAGVALKNIAAALHGIANVVLFLMILVVALVLSYKYCERFNSFRLTAFVGKFIEVCGWVAMLSVIGVIGGLILAWLGQAILIFHRSAYQGENFVTEEEVIRLREGVDS